jgi:hypothetical protein
VEAEPPISEDVRQRGIDFLKELLASGKVELDRFQSALDQLLDARTHADFASAIRSLPPPVELTPAARRRAEPLEITTSMGEVRLKGRWQVGRVTRQERLSPAPLTSQFRAFPSCGSARPPTWARSA